MACRSCGENQSSRLLDEIGKRCGKPEVCEVVFLRWDATKGTGLVALLLVEIGSVSSFGVEKAKIQFALIDNPFE